MEEQALLGLSPDADAHTQQQTIAYFERLKNSVDGWQLCGNALAAGTYQNNDQVNFFCLQVIEHYLKNRYGADVGGSQESVKVMLHSWLDNGLRGINDHLSKFMAFYEFPLLFTQWEKLCLKPSLFLDGMWTPMAYLLSCIDCSLLRDKCFLRNKAAQLFCLAFLVDFPLRWPAFFSDLLARLAQGERHVDLYLRVLQAIASEVVDREIAHTPQELDRNTMLKDAMRLHCVPQLVDSWYQIITTYKTDNPQLTCLCLDVIGSYVSWIDINLVANDCFVPPLLQFMSLPLLRESACDCIHEMLNKGMEPLAKNSLIESFSAVLCSAGLFTPDQNEDGDYLAKLAKLINGIGCQLVQNLQRLKKVGDAAGVASTIATLDKKMPLLLGFLENEDDDVSQTVTEFAHTYITMLRASLPLSPQHALNIKELLRVIIKKMKYDSSYDFEQEGEDEAMFQEYRKELKVIFKNLGVLDPELLLTTVQEMVKGTLANWQSADFSDVELVLTLVYMLGEALPAAHGQHFGVNSTKTSALQQMMKIMMESQVSHCQHSAVRLQFFETAVRFDRFFTHHTHFIPELLMAFLDERGLRSETPHLCSRTAYLFSRFVKTVNKPPLQDYLSEVLGRVHGLLRLPAPDCQPPPRLSPADQTFVYEAVSVLVIQSQLGADGKRQLMQQLLAPIVDEFESLLQRLVSETDEGRRLAYTDCLCHAMAFASRTSKGFSAEQTMSACGCVDVYTHTLRAFLRVLDAPVGRACAAPLHASLRQYLHRMVVCLDVHLLPFVPVAVGRLLKGADARHLHDFIPLVNQLVCKFKAHIVPFLSDVFLPIVQMIFAVLVAPADERDLVAAAEKAMLRRGYFSFIGTLVSNNVTEVLSSQSMENLHQVLMTVVQGAVDVPDPVAQKACFVILRKLVDTWAANKDVLPAFDDFMYKNIVPACFAAPLKTTFDLNDAQTVLVLGECSSCLQAVLNKKGDELIHFLQLTYLPTLQVTAAISQEFCQALKSDSKIFRSYFKTFVSRAKS